jgi:hypothetical protein
MEGGSIIILLMVIGAGIFFGILQMQSEAETANRKPIAANSLRSSAKLEGERNWLVTIKRRSGYVHEAWTIFGNARSAIDSAVSKLQQARIYDVHVRSDTKEKLDVIAFYESTGSRRTGKYVGGFVIEPA